MEVVGEVLATECILISNPNCEHRDMVKMLTRRIEGCLVAKKYVMISYNIHNDLLEKALKLTPGKKSPNITALAQTDFKAISCLVNKKQMNTKMDELHDIGATDILTFALSNTRM